MNTTLCPLCRKRVRSQASHAKRCTGRKVPTLSVLANSAACHGLRVHQRATSYKRTATHVYVLNDAGGKELAACKTLADLQAAIRREAP